MHETPEATIRRYLDRHGGSVEVPADNLLTTWGFPRLDAEAWQRIGAALASVRVQVRPSLSSVVARESRVTLSIVEEEGAPPSAPWGEPAEVSPNGEPQREVALELPRRPPREGPSRGARLRHSLRPRRETRPGLSGVAARLRARRATGPSPQCTVCGRTPEELGEGPTGSSWSAGGGLSLCPRCQAEGWQLPPRGGLPFKYRVPRT